MGKKQTLNLVLNQIKKDNNDSTILPCSFVILDFDVSLNNVKVVKEVALEGGKTLLNKPIVAKYHRVSSANANDDNFGSHEEYMTENKHGKDVLERDTVAMGVFTSPGYLAEIMVDGVWKEVMVADGVLWYSKYKDACDLLLEWYERGIKINMSCEYLYQNYSFIEGVEYHHSPIIFESHAILASENRGEHEKVIPAYEAATMLSINEFEKFNTFVAQAANQAKEDKPVEEKELNNANENEELDELEVSPEEAEDKLEEELNAEEETTLEEQNEDETALNEVAHETLDQEINELKETIEQLSAAKAELEEKFNAAAETITQLNSLVEELKPYREQQVNAQKEKELTEKMNHFSSKFEAVGAKEKFESEEVQTLIAQSIGESDEAKEALLKLNTMIVDFVQQKQDETSLTPQIVGLASYRKNLVKGDDSFDSRYKL